ncbi:MAG: hypothetical protein Q7R43_04395 [Candidatus Daviesbacteria bacterium]|nr:hypothetical protein [Candidatus Daviesbacteria bacterium]
MLTLTQTKGLLSYISDIEKLEASKIASSLNSSSDLKIIENQIGNLLLYPQTVPTTEGESSFDLSLLKEILRLEPQNFYNPNLKKIYIPEIFSHIYPNLSRLAFIFIDTLKPVNLTSFFLKSETLGIKNLGTYIKPENVLDHCFLDVYVDQQKFHIMAGNIAIIPSLQRKVDIKMESNCNIIEGKNEFITEATGGDIGIIIDFCQSK